jgi:cytochrome P450
VEFFSEEMRRNPYPLYAQMREAAPLLHLPQFDLWLIFDFESVKRAINDPVSFSSAASQGRSKPFDWLIFSDPPRHTKWRAIIMRAFTPRMVANLEPRIRELSHELLDPWIQRGEMDLAADYAARLPLLVIAEMLGIPLADRPQFKRWSDAILGLANTLTGGETATRALEQFSAAILEMRPYVAAQVEKRRATPSDDLLSRLVDAEVDGERLTEEEILGFFQLLLLAGSETTTNLINNAMLSLLEHPEQQERLRTTPELIPSAIEEVLRYRSPLQAVFRKTTCDVAMHGQTIPAGSLVLPMIGSANRDPSQFAQPDRFDILRDPNPHIAFGHGPHFCLGAPLARLEGRIALEDLLTRLVDVKLASNEPWEPRDALHVYGPTRLPIVFEPNHRTAPLTR